MSSALAESVSENDNSKLTEEDAPKEVIAEINPKEKKKKPSKKRMQKKIIENTDTNDKEGYEENSKQKRKGWWSLNG